MSKVKQLLNYCTTHEDALLMYSASDMVLVVHSGAGYLKEWNARSQVKGHFYSLMTSIPPPITGAILNIAQVIKVVMSLTTEAEIDALYINVREANIRQVLLELGHLQKQTQIQTNNSMANSVINHKVQPKCTKAMDMHFHWLQNQNAKEQFRFFRWLDAMNFADY